MSMTLTLKTDAQMANLLAQSYLLHLVTTSQMIAQDNQAESS